MKFKLLLPSFLCLSVCANSAGLTQNAQLEGAKPYNSVDYSNALAKAIRRKLFPPNEGVDRPTVFLIEVSPEGKLLTWIKVKSSGNKLIDNSAQIAVTSSSPYPKYLKGSDKDSIRDFTVIVDPFNSLYLMTTVLVQERQDLAEGGGMKRVYGAAKLNH